MIKRSERNHFTNLQSTIAKEPPDFTARERVMIHPRNSAVIVFGVAGRRMTGEAPEQISCQPPASRWRMQMPPEIMHVQRQQPSGLQEPPYIFENLPAIAAAGHHPQRTEQQQGVIELPALQAAQLAQIRLQEDDRRSGIGSSFGGDGERFARQIDANAFKTAVGKIHKRTARPASQIEQSSWNGEPAGDSVVVEIQ